MKKETKQLNQFHSFNNSSATHIKSSVADTSHISYLKLALDLAKINRGFCAPNPSVGALIVDSSGNILATGYHSGPGSVHAEVDALRKLKHVPEDAILYVTLEPCCHTGRTPPCTSAIIQSRIRHVIYAYRDPNPIVSGRGENILTSAGILCEHQSLLEINSFYESYHYWHRTKKPYITAKIAMTLDGKFAGLNSEPIQITSDPINQFTHQYRKEHDAILTTVKTIMMDDPQLNARSQNEVIPKPIYILDRKLQLPIQAKIFSTAKSITIFHENNVDEKNLQRLIKLNVRCIPVKSENNLLDLTEIIKLIGQDGIHDLWIEAGGQCLTSFLKNSLLHRLFIYIAPYCLGKGKNLFTEAFTFDMKTKQIRWKQVGQDVLCEIELGDKLCSQAL